MPKNENQKAVVDYLKSQGMPRSKAEIERAIGSSLKGTLMPMVLAALVKSNAISVDNDTNGIPHYSVVSSITLDPNSDIDRPFIHLVELFREASQVAKVPPVTITDKKDKLDLIKELSKTPFLPEEKLKLLVGVVNDLRKLEEAVEEVNV
jgi:hypothetical protein